MRKSFPKMNKRRRKTIAGIMAIVLLVCIYPSLPVYADKVSELEQKLKEEKEKKKDTENKIGESQSELDSLRNTTNGLKGMRKSREHRQSWKKRSRSKPTSMQQ